MDDVSFQQAVARALDEVLRGTGLTAHVLFGDGDAFQQPYADAEVARAIGYLEGAASSGVARRLVLDGAEWGDSVRCAG